MDDEETIKKKAYMKNYRHKKKEEAKKAKELLKNINQNEELADKLNKIEEQQKIEKEKKDQIINELRIMTECLIKYINDL
jgi:hypothetical protein